MISLLYVWVEFGFSCMHFDSCKLLTVSSHTITYIFVWEGGDLGLLYPSPLGVCERPLGKGGILRD